MDSTAPLSTSCSHFQEETEGVWGLWGDPEFTNIQHGKAEAKIDTLWKVQLSQLQTTLHSKKPTTKILSIN